MIRLTLALLLFALFSAAAPAAEPPEVSYSQLEWKDDVFFLNGKPYTGVARDKHKDGKPKAEYPFKDGRLHGVVKEWWENGQLSTETHFDGGQRHGLNRYWAKSGELMKEQMYEHDKSVSEKHFEVK